MLALNHPELPVGVLSVLTLTPVPLRPPPAPAALHAVAIATEAVEQHRLVGPAANTDTHQ